MANQRIGEIKIVDFRGGRNTVGNQILLNPNECVATSDNVWCPSGMLVKTPGMSINASFTATGNAMGRIWVDSTVNTAFQIYSRIKSGTNNYSLWASVGSTDSLTPLGYTTGTVSVSGGSRISATGSGTTWLTHVTAGDLFRVDSSAANWFVINSIEDNTHLTLASGPGVNVATGAAYTILPSFQLQDTQEASLNGSMWMSSHYEIMQRYDGSGVTRIPAAPKGAFLSVFKNYMFSFRTTTAESRLYWSTIKDPTSWPTNNFIDIDKDRGKGTGMIAYGNELICFKTYGMYKVIGDIFEPTAPTYSVLPISTPPSFRFNSSSSAVVHNGILYFIANDGIYTYQQGTGFITRVSDKITYDLPNDVGDFNDLTANSRRYHGFSFDGNLIFKGSLDSTTNFYYALIMDRNGAWWRVDNRNEQTTVSPFDTVPMVSLAQSAARPLLLTGSRSNPRHYAWDLSSAYINATVSGSYVLPSDGSASAISSEWRSKEFNIEYGHFDSLILYFKKQSSGGLTYGWSIDQGTFVTASADMTVGRGNLVRMISDINQLGSTIQLKFIQNGSNTPIGIYAATITYDPILENRRL